MDKQDGDSLTTKEHTEAHAGKIETYRKLTAEEIAGVNALKELEADVAARLKVITANLSPDRPDLQHARHYLRTGFMYATRSVAKPVGGI